MNTKKGRRTNSRLIERRKKEREKGTTKKAAAELWFLDL